MQQRLTDIERTLLSAYHDGELSGVEKQRAEELLAGSQSAQAYVRDLRNLNSLSAIAFPAAGATTAVGGSAAAKLSSSAIRAAAQKGVVSKGMFAGGWGMAGMAGAAVAVVAVAVMTLMPSSKTEQTPLDLQQPTASQEQAAAPMFVKALDTSSLIVPAMTADELVSFAMNGTLPIDENRKRFICVGDTGTASPALHAELPVMLRQELGTLDPKAIRGLDSIKEVVRTSLLNYSGDRIAIRNDMDGLRLSVLQHIETSLSPRLPAETRQRLMVARASIEASAREIDREAREIEQDAREMEAGVQYVLLPEQRIAASASSRTMVRLSPQEFSSPRGQNQVVLIGSNSLDDLREKMETTSVMTAGASPRAYYRQTVTASVSAGSGTPRSKGNTIRVMNFRVPKELPPLLMIEDDSMYDPLDHTRPPTPPRSSGASFQTSSEGTSFSIDQKDMDRLLNGVQRSLDRADSIMREVETRVQRKQKEVPCGDCKDLKQDKPDDN